MTYECNIKAYNNKNEINVLDELNKGACMGMNAIKFVLDKVEDDEFHSLLERKEGIKARLTEKEY